MVNPNRIRRKGVTPRTDEEAVQAMNNRKVVRSSKEEDLLPEQVIELLNRAQRGGISAADYEFMKSIVMPKYHALVESQKKDMDAVKAAEEKMKEELARIFANHLKSFKNLILDDVE